MVERKLSGGGSVLDVAGWAGALIVVDSLNHRVRLIPMSDRWHAADGLVTVSGNGTSGFRDGEQPLSTLSTPVDITIGPPPAYLIYISMPHCIRTLDPATLITSTLAGVCGAAGSGYRDGNHSVARFFEPSGLHAVHTVQTVPNPVGGGDLFVADQTNNRIRVWVAHRAQWVTIIGQSGVSGNRDGTPATATVYLPTSIVTPPSPVASTIGGWQEPTESTSLYIVDSGNSKIRSATAICTSSCLNGGYCNSTLRCQCAAGFEEDDCSIGAGTCPPGYSVPPACTTPVCVGAATCQNGATCTAPNFCTCDVGWSGSSTGCNTPVCAPPCLNGGNCTAINTCSCPLTYSGADCSVPVCTINGGCQNGGTCISPDVCACSTGWGYNITGCVTPLCNLHGCNSTTGNCTAPDTCECYTGSGGEMRYSGLDCNTPICSGIHACAANGTCTAPDHCTCNAGYGGLTCAVPDCTSLGNCNSHGTCTAPNQCNCLNVWAPPDCVTPICTPVCSPNEVCYAVNLTATGCKSLCSPLCINGGSCLANGQCNCTSGWTGVSCAQAVCPLSGCGHGVCSYPFSCECFDGWTSANCSQPICAESDGVNCVNGRCVAPNQCACDAGWSDTNCTTAICNRLGITTVTPGCQFGGRCYAPDRCNCTTGYEGQFCDAAICTLGCIHGSCAAPERCACSEGFEGISCNDAIVQSAWEQYYYYWVAVLVTGSIALLLFLLWQRKMSNERTVREQLHRDMMDRRPKPLHWRPDGVASGGGGDEDSDNGPRGDGFDDEEEERREAAAAATAAAALAGWGAGLNAPPAQSNAGGAVASPNPPLGFQLNARGSTQALNGPQALTGGAVGARAGARAGGARGSIVDVTGTQTGTTTIGTAPVGGRRLRLASLKTTPMGGAAGFNSSVPIEPATAPIGIRTHAQTASNLHAVGSRGAEIEMGGPPVLAVNRMMSQPKLSTATHGRKDSQDSNASNTAVAAAVASTGRLPPLIPPSQPQQ